MTQTQPLEYPQLPPQKKQWVSDDLAYILPMGVFLGFIYLQGKWPDKLPILYGLKTLCTAIVLLIFWKRYTRIRWNAWWLGLIVGIMGIFQWVGMQLWLQHRFSLFAPSATAFNPFSDIHSTRGQIYFIAVRMIGAVLVVPVMEELFWRDYLWRQIIAPNDFKLAAVGEWSLVPFLAVSAAFSMVHGNCWLTAIIWGLMVAGLLVWTRSLGACIIAHATTNLLLGLYVLHSGHWELW